MCEGQEKRRSSCYAPSSSSGRKQRPTSKCLSCWNVLAQLRGLGRSFSSLFLLPLSLLFWSGELANSLYSQSFPCQVSYRTPCLTRHAYHTAFCRHPPEPPPPPQACLHTPRALGPQNYDSSLETAGLQEGSHISVEGQKPRRRCGI